VKVHSNGHALEINFPAELKIHCMVSIQHVEKAVQDVFKRSTPALPQVAKFPKSVFDKRTTRGRTKYKVKFEDYDVTQAEWIDKEDLPRDLVKEYERRLGGRRVTALAAGMSDDDGIKVAAEHSKLHPLYRSFPAIRPKPRSFVECPVLYISRATHPFERSYESTERELACVS